MRFDELLPAAYDYLEGVVALDGPERVARYTVDHVRDVTGAEWAEFVEVRESGPLAVLATGDPHLTGELLEARELAGAPPPPDEALPLRTVVISDLAADSPWQEFAAVAVARTPVRSAVLAYVKIPDRSAAVLPVYDPRIGFFDEQHQAYIRYVADLAGLALSRLAAAEQGKTLLAGMQSSRTIGTAVGILSERYQVSPDGAFRLLATTSQRSNRKVKTIAGDIVAGRERGSGRRTDRSAS
jgi:GAF domain-containing protein